MMRLPPLHIPPRFRTTMPKTDAFAFHYSPKTEDQRAAVRAFQDHDLLFLLGPAGGGKTFIALALALEAVKTGGKKRVVFVRPAVEAGERLGFLPGLLDEKVEPYLGPLRDITSRLTFKLPPDVIESKTLAYMRGCTFDDAVIVLSESQNATYAQLKMVITRLGKNSKLVVEGDPDQSDLPSGGDDLLDVVERMESEPGVAVVDFDAEVTLRHPLVRTALRVL